VLVRAIDVAAAGDYEEVPLIDRVLSVIEECGTQEVRQFAAVAHFTRTLNERMAPLIRVIEQTASTDPALQELRTRQIGAIRAKRAVVVGKFWRTALRPGLSADQAADAMAMMLSAHVYSMLTVDLGWSPDRSSSGLPTRSLIYSCGRNCCANSATEGTGFISMR
jgi:hypothetical protein